MSLKTLTRSISLAVLFCLLFSLAGCGGGNASLSGGSATTNPNVTSVLDNTNAGAGVSIGAQDAEKVDIPFDQLSDQDKVYRLMDLYPLMFNGIGPKEYASRRSINKGLGNIPLKDKPSDYVIGFSGGAMSSPYFINLIESTAANAEYFGFTVLTQLNAGNAELSYQQLDSFITQGVDGIMASSDPTTTEPYYRRAAEAGIPVIATSSQAMRPDNPVITNFLGGGLVMGFLVGEYAADYLVHTISAIRPEFADPDYVFQIGHILMGISGGESQSRNAGFYSGFLYKLAEIDGHPYPNKYAAIVDGGLHWQRIIDVGKYDPSKGPEGWRVNTRGYGDGRSADAPGGQRGAEDLLVAHPDIDILFLDTDATYPGVEVVMAQNNIVPGKDIFTVAAANGQPSVLELIKKDEVIAIGNNSSDHNAWALSSCMRSIFLDRRDMNNIVPNTYNPTVAITKHNVDQYYIPDRIIALGIPFELEDIDDYNERMKTVQEVGDPFYYPG
ncbi:MAG: substrate-binding domain-containing protein, partial [Clostridiales bacterium]|nr:substrate-binding domain-containing protein [Clostridiales bacterium]